MKNSAAYTLLVIGMLLIALMAGFFLGRNSVSSPVIISPLSTQIKTPGLLNINTASAEDLMTLPGIGETLAQRIITYRNTNGSFSSLSELTLVDGIGIDILEKISDYATVKGE